MRPYPHVYRVNATAMPTGNVTVASTNLPPLQTAPPAEFDGPGDAWSPETLLCGAIADCFILTFKAIARAAKFEWSQLECHVDGTLERVDAAAQFTQYAVRATLTLAGNADEAKARSLLERSERSCLISNSYHRKAGRKEAVGGWRLAVSRKGHFYPSGLGADQWKTSKKEAVGGGG